MLINLLSRNLQSMQDDTTPEGWKYILNNATSSEKALCELLFKPKGGFLCRTISRLFLFSLLLLSAGTNVQAQVRQAYSVHAGIGGVSDPVMIQGALCRNSISALQPVGTFISTFTSRNYAGFFKAESTDSLFRLHIVINDPSGGVLDLQEMLWASYPDYNGHAFSDFQWLSTGPLDPLLTTNLSVTASGVCSIPDINLADGDLTGTVRERFSARVGGKDVTIFLTLVVDIDPDSVNEPGIKVTDPELNWDTGCYEQIVTLENRHPTADAVGVRLTISELNDWVVHNATGTNSVGDYLIEFKALIPHQTSLDMLVQYLSDTEWQFNETPQFDAEFIWQTRPDEIRGVTVQITYIEVRSNGEVDLEFLTQAGRTYAVQYCSDLVVGDWNTVVPYIQNQRDPAAFDSSKIFQMYWTDRGVPTTESHPSSVKKRYYRVVEIYEEVD